MLFRSCFNPPDNIEQKPRRYDRSKSHTFVDNLNTDDVQSILQSAHEARNQCDPDTVDQLAERVSRLMTRAARASFGTRKAPVHNKHVKRKGKPWFSKECKHYRKVFNKAKMRLKKSNNLPNKESFQKASKEYKKCMDRHIRLYKQQLQDMLRNKQKYLPREFWTFFNKKLDQAAIDDIPTLDTFFEYFKDQNSTDDATLDDSQFENVSEHTPDDYDCTELNDEITLQEITKAINKLKRNKASGVDQVENDYIIDSVDILAPVYVEFFNLVLTTGTLPELWLNGIIKPIYKNKGNSKDPNNYRPITILSCLGKLFTRILNTRLSNFLDKNSILSAAQAGFRKHFMTADNIFVLHILTHFLKLSKRKLYCAFIDFSKAFDTVWRVGLWTKLQKSGVKGKILTLIINMYNNIKSQVQVNNTFSDYFPCLTGVRQGENLSPLLFSIFLNDLEPHLMSKDCCGVTLEVKNRDDSDIIMCIQLILLLYADDTVIFDVTPTGLQKTLDAFFNYSVANRLNVNISKTKIIVFGGGPAKTSKLSFHYGNKSLEIVDTYTYLGVNMHRNRRFTTGIKTLCDNALKAMFALLKKIRNLHIPLDTSLALFDTLVVPILSYGSEVWAYENLDLVERVHLKFLKFLAGLRNSTPAFMVYGELGRMPLYIKIHKRAVAFWHKLHIHNDVIKLSQMLYKFIVLDTRVNGNAYPWLSFINRLFNNLGLSYILQNPSGYSTPWLVAKVEQILSDQFSQKWREDILASPKGIYYQHFKQSLKFEPYLLLPRTISQTLLKFRTSNHNLPIETGRWSGIPREDRLCPLCNSPAIADEFHYLFKCPALSEDRIILLSNEYFNWPNLIKMKKLLCSSKTKTLRNLSQFIKIVTKKL